MTATNRCLITTCLLAFHINQPINHQGMIHITLTKIENLKSTDLLSKGDPYVIFEV